MPGPVTHVRRLVDSLASSRAHLEQHDAHVVEEQVAVARIPAPTGHERRRAAWVAERLSDAGLADVGIDAAGNVVSRALGSSREAPVVVCAHLDTVLGPVTGDRFEVSRHGARLSAPGIGDNARGLAALLALAREFGSRRVPLRRDVILAATTGEEGLGNLAGARHLFDTLGLGAHAAVAIDGPGDERVVTCALGSRRYRVEFHGAGGHSWAQFGSPNAVQAAAVLATRLGALPLSERPRSALSVARIGGGSAVNAIPADAWLEVDARSPSGAELARLDRSVRELTADAVESENARRRPGSTPLSASISLIGDRPAGDVPAGEDIVVTALEATRCIGRTPELAVASTDANIPISRGIPAIAIGGGGRGGETHTPHEWYENTDGARGVLRALLVVAALAT